MSTRLISTLASVSLLALVLGACTLPVSTPAAAFHVEVFDPAAGAVLQVGQEVYVDAEAFSDSDTSPITRLDFYVNGVWLGSASGSDLYPSTIGPYGEAYWTPSAAGEYQLQASAMRRGGMVISAPVRVCVVDFAVDSGNYFATASGYEGPCPIPDRDAAARPGAITIAADASPASFVYIPAGADGVIPGEVAGCSPSRTIHFRATVVDPPEDVALVDVMLSLSPGPGASPHYAGGGARTSALVLTQTGAFPGSTRIFEGSTAPAPNPGFMFGDLGGSITWTAQAIGRDGAILVTDGPHDIPATPCVPAAPVSAPFTPAPSATTAPTATKVPGATATWTPSAENCPAGTYYSPNTNQCLAIQIIPTKPGPAEDCSAFGNKGNCRRNGCNWDDKAGICTR